MLKRNLAFVEADTPGEITASPKSLVKVLVLGAGGPHDLPNGLVPGVTVTAVTGSRGAVLCYYHWSGEPTLGNPIDRLAQKDERGVYYTLKAVRVRDADVHRPAVGQWIMVLNGAEKGYVTREHRVTGDGLVFDPVDSFGPHTITEWVPVKPAAVVPKVEDPVTEHDEKALAEAVIAGEKEPTGAVLRAAAIALEKLEKENSDLKKQVEEITTSRNHYQSSLISIWEALESEAENRDWCSEYDEFAADQGGPARERTITVVVEMTSNPSPNAADDVVASLLNNTESPVDVRQIEIKHRGEAQMKVRIHPEDQPDDGDIETALQEAGWDFNDFEFIEWYE